jgi:hypothetical protein
VSIEVTEAASRIDVASRRTLGRTAAWLSKQVEIGLAGVDLSLPQYRILGLLDEIATKEKKPAPAAKPPAEA